MSWREKLFIEALHKDAKITLEQIMSRRRSAFWGETPVLLRVRKYKQAGEVRDTRVSVVKPQLNTVRLWSVMKQARVKLDTTPQMLRFIEASGGLDDYLLQTPDDKLKSDAASLLKLELLQMIEERKAARNGLPAERQAYGSAPSPPRPTHPTSPASVGRPARDKTGRTAKSTPGQLATPSARRGETGQAPTSNASKQAGAATGDKQAGGGGGPGLSVGAATVLLSREELAVERKARIERMLKAAASSAVPLQALRA